jgi:DNA modification methylase
VKITILQGDNRVRLKEFPDNHFDSCVCDPPYELGFMGKKWDSSCISHSVEMWREVWRVLKPGAYLLAFGGSRTYHRLTCAIEDAGFQIRDQIMWLYGTGFPKSLDVGKAIDKAAGAEREVIGKKSGRAGDPKQDIRGGNFMSGTRDRIDCSGLTAPATPIARQWNGWGTALKPAHEPIVVARKPLEGTVIKNVLKWGCGGINIAACRIPAPDGKPLFLYRQGLGSHIYGGGLHNGNRTGGIGNERWPANVIHDGSDEVLAEFAKYGERKTGNTCTKRISGKDKKGYKGAAFGHESRPSGTVMKCYIDNGVTAARFYYCAKASPAERNRGLEGAKKSVILIGAAGLRINPATGLPVVDIPRGNNHPTVKPLALMAYLVRLVTPPGGEVLDPFMGSGSTLIAAAKEGFDSVGIDLEAEYCDISERRCLGNLGMTVEINKSCTTAKSSQGGL